MKKVNREKGYQIYSYHSNNLDFIRLTELIEVFPSLSYSFPKIIKYEDFYLIDVEAKNGNSLIKANNLSKNLKKGLKVALIELIERVCTTGVLKKTLKESYDTWTISNNWLKTTNGNEIFLGTKNSFGYPNNSNGVAVGASLSEAKYFSLLELMERDTFLNYWYLHKVPHKVKLEEKSPLNYKMNILQNQGFIVEIFFLQNEFNYPVIWILCRSIEPDNFASYTTTAISKDINIAIEKALDESIYGLFTYHDVVQVKKIGKLVKKKGFKEIYDNACYYSLEENRSTFDYLNNAEYLDLSQIQAAPSELDYEVELNQINEQLLNDDYEAGYIIISSKNDSTRISTTGFWR
ncbi:MAG: YcaO-like family protein [Enterococcus lacertideformus]|uniref:YcaO-like family protein n=1 Tax=Enterococcus lacertideformus TaxID=2771493 RepID=A0A931AV20_9ENTE|nr:YcaO-like family protein [Enterococcus lacertideformus]